MPLEPSQQAQFQTWVESKNIKPNCPACGRFGKWTPGDIINSPTRSGAIRKDGTIQLSEKTIPMVQLICGSCAYIMLFAAGQIGLE